MNSLRLDDDDVTRRLVVYADGPDGPLPDPERIGELLREKLSVVLGWVVRTPSWLETTSAPITSVVVGAGLRRGVSEGRVRPVGMRLSAISGWLSGRLKPDVAVVGAVESPSSPGGWRLVGSPGWAAAAVTAAERVVIERWSPTKANVVGPQLPPCEVIGVVDRVDGPDPVPEVRMSPTHEEIGRLVATLIPEGATVQWGPGAVGAAVMSALDQPVRVRSGLVTDELVGLSERGLLTGPAEAAYLWGGRALSAMVDSGALQLREVSYTHDLSLISGTDRFVAINAALEVGLDGAVNVETTGGRIITGPGGHPDFSTGASRSPGGLSVIAVTSTFGLAGDSTIVVRPAVVSTPRSDVDVVVTEHGVADLRGCSDRERALRLVAVAAPQHRATLAEQVL